MPDAESIFVLIHSPLVGPLTWQPVAAELRRRGAAVVVPVLSATKEPGTRHWQQHVEAVVEAVEMTAFDRPVVPVGHSGAGALLPAVRTALGLPVAGYIFVDAGLPTDGKSRLGMFEQPEAAMEFRRSAVNGLLPIWSEGDLAEDIPDPELRRSFVSELRPVPLVVYEEPIPVFAGWPDAPCGYIQFSHAYDAPAAGARAAGWPTLVLPGGHFEMLVNPERVTDALLRLKEELVRT